jgi:hypothetical protein
MFIGMYNTETKSETNVGKLYGAAKEQLNQAIHGYSMFLVFVLFCVWKRYESLVGCIGHRLSMVHVQVM